MVFYSLYAKIAGFVALAVGILYGTHVFLNHERKLGYDKAVAEYTAKQVLAEQAARAKEAQLSTKLEEAQNAATLREQHIKTIATKLAATSNSLRDAISASRRSLPTATVDAARNTADAALSIFGECQAKYGEMAENADRHASDVKTLEDAWPK